MRLSTSAITVTLIVGAALIFRGPAYYPLGLAVPTARSKEALADRVRMESPDSHLRSTVAITWYHIQATDGEIGHLEGFIVDDEVWAIRYIVAATQNWWPGKKILISPSWIQDVSWEASKVYVGLSQHTIKNGPEFIESMPITREHEGRLHLHYGRPPYWQRDPNPNPSFSLSGV
jgi:hypothetical protein